MKSFLHFPRENLTCGLSGKFRVECEEKCGYVARRHQLRKSGLILNKIKSPVTLRELKISLFKLIYHILINI